MKWTAVTLALLPVPAWSGPDRVSLTLGTHHTDPTVDWTEINPGLFLTWEERAFGLDYSVGAFRNSFGGPSIAAVGAWPILSLGQAGELSLFGGLAYYPGHGDQFLVAVRDIVPMGGLQVRHGPVFGQLMPGKLDPVEVIFVLGFTLPLGASDP